MTKLLPKAVTRRQFSFLSFYFMRENIHHSYVYNFCFVCSPAKRQLRAGGAGGRQAGSGPVPQETIDKAASQMLTTITKFTKAKQAGQPLPTPQEIGQVISEAVKTVGLGDGKNLAQTVETGLDALADKKVAGK